MTRLTQEEAGLVIAEADRIMRHNINNHIRLGQAIWISCDDQYSNLSKDLRDKMYLLLDSDRTTTYDFYHWKNEHEVITSFYARYVEKQQ